MPAETLIVAISSCRDEKKLLEAALLAAPHGTRCIAVHIDAGTSYSTEEQHRLSQNIAFAKQKSFEILVTTDSHIVAGLCRVAEENRASILYIGKSAGKPGSKIARHPRIAAGLAIGVGSYEVRIAVTGEKLKKASWFKLPPPGPYSHYAVAWLLVLFAASGSYFVKDHIGYQSVSLLLLLLVSALPLLQLGVGPVLSATLLSAFVWDYFFIPPHFTLTIGKLDDTLMLLLYLIVATVNSSLLIRIIRADRLLRERERRTNALLQLNKDLAESRGLQTVVAKSIRNMESAFGVKALLVLPENGILPKDAHAASSLTLNQFEWSLANWAYQKNETVGKMMHSVPATDRTYYPLRQGDAIVAIAGIELEGEKELTYQQQILLDSFLMAIAVCIENEQRGIIAANATLMKESERLYKTLFNSLSHELHTPITTILTAAGGLQDSGGKIAPSAVHNLLGEIIIAGNRLHRLVQNLLDTARNDAGMIRPKPEWHDLKDLLYSCAQKVSADFPGTTVAVTLTEESTVYRFDYTLLEQAVMNLLRNAANYAPGTAPVDVRVSCQQNTLLIAVADSGPGIPPPEMTRIFDKFYRMEGSKAGGLGLGLSIARGFIEAQGGTIAVSNQDTGGAVFTIQIPLHGKGAYEL